MNVAWKKIFHAVAPYLLGAMALILVVGPRVLYPTNIAWLEHGDPATQYLGWLFFRQSDWSFPIGLNPNYGLEFANSLLYSDSNPLLAFLFKPFSAFLPETFQYFGMWLVMCVVLQAWFGWKLAGLITENSIIRFMGAGLFVFSPPMISRMEAHPNLAGHFFILAALYLILRPNQEKRMMGWGGVLLVAAFVHAYLLAMVGILWFTDLMGQAVKNREVARKYIIEFFALSAAVGFACWQTGYFTVASGLSLPNYGHYRMNLLSIIDPSSWSYLLKDIPGSKGDYEGFNFLGLGVISLLFLSALILITGRAKFIDVVKKKPFPLFALAGLTLFSLTNKIGIGPYDFEYALPNSWVYAANIFASSGRMFWPVFYAIILSVIYIIVRGTGKRTAITLMTLTFLIQIIDTSAGWLPIRNYFMTEPASEWATQLENRFWVDAATKYKKLRIIPPANMHQHWQTLATYAGTHGLATNAVYLARTDSSALKKARYNAALLLITGDYDPDTLYVIDTIQLNKAELSLQSETDALLRVDGLNILAPGWKEIQRLPSR